MKKSFLLAWSSIRKTKGQVITILLIMLLAALLMQVGLTLVIDYPNNYDRRAELTNTEDVLFSYQTRDEALIAEWERILRSDERTREIETQKSLCQTLSFSYGDGEINTHVVILPASVNRTLGQFRFIEKSEAITEEAIYLPYMAKVGSNYRIGDSFAFKIRGREYSFTVGGFYESTLLGSFNGGMFSFLLSDQAYEKVDAETEIQGVLFSVKLKDRSQSADFFSEVGNKMTVSAQNIMNNSNNYAFVKSSRTTTASICSLIFLGISLLIMLVALTVTAFHISNEIQEKMSLFGVLKAVGYTGGQIIRATLLQFLLIAGIAAAAGIALSYCVLPIVNQLLVVQTGIIWEGVFLILPILLVLVFTLGVSALTAYLAAVKIRKLQPITALRQGVLTHNFKRNFFPLEKTRTNLTLALALKSVCGNIKQNIAMFLIVFVLSLVSVFMSVMLQTFVIEDISMLGFMTGEQTDAGVYTSAEENETVYSLLGQRPEVKKIYRYQTVPTLWKGKQLYTSLVDDCANLNNPEICYAGRLPEYANEIALGGFAAKQYGAKIGDMVTIQGSGKSAEYLVTGLTQCSNYLGMDALMLNSGYERITDSPLTGGFYLLLKDGESIDAFLNSVISDYGEKIVSTINMRSVLTGAIGGYTTIVALIVEIFIVIVLAVVALVLYLMIKTFIVRRLRNYGIQKALGFSTKQLILQTVIGFMPMMLIALLVGFTVGVLCVNPLLSVLFAGIGIMKATFPIPALLTAGFALIILIFAFVVSVLVSLRIRRIAPRALIAGE